jgi:hypothetical protein
MTIPKKLYHAAPECALGSINDDGLKSAFGEIYAAETPGDALQFMWFRLLDHVHKEPNPLMPEIAFNVVPHDSIHVWEIKTSKTDVGLWEPGTDHSAAFFNNATSWVYGSKVISRSALSLPKVYVRELFAGLYSPKVEST